MKENYAKQLTFSWFHFAFLNSFLNHQRIKLEIQTIMSNRGNHNSNTWESISSASDSASSLTPPEVSPRSLAAWLLAPIIEAEASTLVTILLPDWWRVPGRESFPKSPGDVSDSSRLAARIPGRLPTEASPTEVPTEQPNSNLIIFHMVAIWWRPTFHATAALLSQISLSDLPVTK